MAQKQVAAVLHADRKARPDYKPTEEEVRTKRATYASRKAPILYVAYLGYER